ncbi:MAG: hypothetical protein HC765_14305 [Brachymonas sp.]|nr:hypothetical protein [Brachymonas sp.]
MDIKSTDFTPFTVDAQRIAANLEQSYFAWLDAQRQLADLPSSMFWVRKQETDYLHIKQTTRDNGTSIGARSEQTEQQLEQYLKQRSELEERVTSLSQLLQERGKLYRMKALRLPFIADAPVHILRQLDIDELLGLDVIVVGTNAFAAYELLAGAKFPGGNETTEDFDMAWCRDTKASLAALAPRTRSSPKKTVFASLRAVDSSYAINRAKQYQAINKAGYEVELLAAPSTHPIPKTEAFNPMATLVEQEWLLMGDPLSAVLTSQSGIACQLVVPDPRYMALHKLWLSKKPMRNKNKIDKDNRQGTVLLEAVRHFFTTSHPLNVDFIFSLPGELRPIFDDWCAQRQFVPAP